MRLLMPGIVTSHATRRELGDKMSIGYSFRWYVREMAKVKGIKLLAVNGVEPVAEAIGVGC